MEPLRAHALRARHTFSSKGALRCKEATNAMAGAIATMQISSADTQKRVDGKKRTSDWESIGPPFLYCSGSTVLASHNAMALRLILVLAMVATGRRALAGARSSELNTSPFPHQWCHHLLTTVCLICTAALQLQLHSCTGAAAHPPPPAPRRTACKLAMHSSATMAFTGRPIRLTVSVAAEHRPVRAPHARTVL